jgi:hypothetical protein
MFAETAPPYQALVVALQQTAGRGCFPTFSVWKRGVENKGLQINLLASLAKSRLFKDLLRHGET